MKINVYQSVDDTYVEMEVLDRYKYLGESDELEFINNKIYDCVGYENGMARLVDETGEDYLYSLDNFEKINENQ